MSLGASELSSDGTMTRRFYSGTYYILTWCMDYALQCIFLSRAASELICSRKQGLISVDSAGFDLIPLKNVAQEFQIKFPSDYELILME